MLVPFITFRQKLHMNALFALLQRPIRARASSAHSEKTDFSLLTSTALNVKEGDQSSSSSSSSPFHLTWKSVLFSVSSGRWKWFWLWVQRGNCLLWRKKEREGNTFRNKKEGEKKERSSEKGGKDQKLQQTILKTKEREKKEKEMKHPKKYETQTERWKKEK